MSEREFAKSLIDQIGCIMWSPICSEPLCRTAAPNAETSAVIQELDAGGGEVWTGTHADLLGK